MMMVGVFSELCRHPKKRAVVDLDRRRCLLVFCCSASRGGVGGGTKNINSDDTAKPNCGKTKNQKNRKIKPGGLRLWNSHAFTVTKGGKAESNFSSSVPFWSLFSF